MSIQKSFTFRDVEFYRDGSIFAAPVSGKDSIINTAITVVTSHLHTSHAWLVQALLGLALSGSGSVKKPITPNTPKTVVLVTTTIASTEVYRRGLLKTGIDLSSTQNFHVIDLSHLLFDAATSASTKITAGNIKDKIEKTLATGVPTNKSQTLVLFESPDLLVPLGMSPRAVSDIVAYLASMAANLFVFCHADSELVDSQVGNIGGNDQRVFLTDIMYQADVVVSIRPLPTGRADDVTGTLTVSTGPANIFDNVKEEYYQYQTANESVKLFYKW